MAGPIYVFAASRLKDAWYKLSAEERDSLMAKVRANAEQCGAKPVIACRSLTAEWPHFGIWEFPDMESLQKNVQLDFEVGWFQYVESGRNMIGTKWERPS